jgi:hypothetical protein
MPVFLQRQLVEQLVRKSTQLPGALRNWIAKKIFPSALNQEQAVKEELEPTVLPIGGVKKTRWHYIRQPKETSNWWSQFFTQTQ